jgi:hypothetical protein
VNFFLNQDAWMAALVFAFLMFLGWALGEAVRSRGVGGGGSTRIEDGSLALFGLLLAFCFSGATGHYEVRKELLRNDAMAIGEFVTVSAMLDDPDRKAIHDELARYVEQRLEFGVLRLDDARFPAVVKRGQANLDRLQDLIRHVIETKNTPSIHTPLLNAFNGMTESHDKRLYGIQDRIDGSIVMMLVLFGVFTTFTMGWLHEPTERAGLLRISAYVALVSLVFFVTVDMEQPRRGLMLVSQVPMQALQASLHAAAP